MRLKPVVGPLEREVQPVAVLKRPHQPLSFNQTMVETTALAMSQRAVIVRVIRDTAGDGATKGLAGTKTGTRSTSATACDEWNADPTVRRAYTVPGSRPHSLHHVRQGAVIGPSVHTRLRRTASSLMRWPRGSGRLEEAVATRQCGYGVSPPSYQRTIEEPIHDRIPDPACTGHRRPEFSLRIGTRDRCLARRLPRATRRRSSSIQRTGARCD